VDVGMSIFFQHPEFLEQDDDADGIGKNDHLVYESEKKLAMMAEPLGFDSVWTVEHHFNGYAMVPDPLQFLAFMAGQTTKIRLGSMVAVLPWHKPVRLAESIVMLDHLSEGRYILGIGRGLGRNEFSGLGVPMEEARGIFTEGAEMVIRGLETGVIECDGEFIKQPRRNLRPARSRAAPSPRRCRRSRSSPQQRSVRES
jgi:alkanesulfonate monooxygenase SsuD/methylene tetrahydromethanopterin reductase-like flavin-dependent oxidoreductase (luciferase family)